MTILKTPFVPQFANILAKTHTSTYTHKFPHQVEPFVLNIEIPGEINYGF